MRGLATRFRRLARHPTYTKIVFLFLMAYASQRTWSQRGWPAGLGVAAFLGTLTLSAFLPLAGAWLNDRERWSTPLILAGFVFTVEAFYTKLPTLDCLMTAVVSSLLLGTLFWRLSVARR